MTSDKVKIQSKSHLIASKRNRMEYLFVARDEIVSSCNSCFTVTTSQVWLLLKSWENF